MSDSSPDSTSYSETEGHASAESNSGEGGIDYDIEVSPPSPDDVSSEIPTPENSPTSTGPEQNNPGVPDDEIDIKNLRGSPEWSFVPHEGPDWEMWIDKNGHMWTKDENGNDKDITAEKISAGGKIAEDHLEQVKALTEKGVWSKIDNDSTIDYSSVVARENSIIDRDAIFATVKTAVLVGDRYIISPESYKKNPENDSEKKEIDDTVAPELLLSDIEIGYTPDGTEETPLAVAVIDLTPRILELDAAAEADTEDGKPEEAILNFQELFSTPLSATTAQARVQTHGQPTTFSFALTETSATVPNLSVPGHNQPALNFTERAAQEFGIVLMPKKTPVALSSSSQPEISHLATPEQSMRTADNFRPGTELPTALQDPGTEGANKNPAPSPEQQHAELVKNIKVDEPYKGASETPIPDWPHQDRTGVLHAQAMKNVNSRAGVPAIENSPNARIVTAHTEINFTRDARQDIQEWVLTDSSGRAAGNTGVLTPRAAKMKSTIITMPKTIISEGFNGGSGTSEQATILNKASNTPTVRLTTMPRREAGLGRPSTGTATSPVEVFRHTTLQVDPKASTAENKTAAITRAEEQKKETRTEIAPVQILKTHESDTKPPAKTKRTETNNSMSTAQTVVRGPVRSLFQETRATLTEKQASIKHIEARKQLEMGNNTSEQRRQLEPERVQNFRLTEIKGVANSNLVSEKTNSLEPRVVKDFPISTRSTPAFTENGRKIVAPGQVIHMKAQAPTSPQQHPRTTGDQTQMKPNNLELQRNGRRPALSFVAADDSQDRKETLSPIGAQLAV